MLSPFALSLATDMTGHISAFLYFFSLCLIILLFLHCSIIAFFCHEYSILNYFNILFVALTVFQKLLTSWFPMLIYKNLVWINIDLHSLNAKTLLQHIYIFTVLCKTMIKLISSLHIISLETQYVIIVLYNCLLVEIGEDESQRKIHLSYLCIYLCIQLYQVIYFCLVDSNYCLMSFPFILKDSLQYFLQDRTVSNKFWFVYLELY